MKRKLTMALVTLLSLSGTSYGSHPWEPYLEAAGAPEYADFGSVVLLDSTRVSVETTGKGSFAVCKAIKINNREGALQHRVLTYDYDPLTAAAEFKRVTVFHKDGTSTEADLSKTLDYAAPASMIYWGARQIMIELGELQPGDIIDYEIAKKGFTYALLGSDDDSRFIPPMRGQFYDIVPFWTALPTMRKTYSVSLPKDRETQFQFYQGTCTSSLRYSGDRKIYSFSVDRVMPFKAEPNMLDLYDVAPKLMMSTTPDWKEKSRWFYKVNEDYGSFEPIPEARKKVEEIIKGKEGEMEKIAVLTHWVADNIRYAGLTMGKGEGFTLHNLQMNYTDRCGVCKDIAGTLVSFLRIAGFQAYPAMTMAGSRVESIPADHFNHCVAVVKLSDGTLMPLDPTWVPFSRELWSSMEQQQNYLPGTPEGTDLSLTPISPAENHYLRIKAANSLSADGTLKGKVTVKAEGQSDRIIRRAFTTGFMSEWESYLEKQLLAVSPKAEMKKVTYSDHPKDYQRAPIELSFTYEIPEYALVDGGVQIFTPFVTNRLFTSVMSFLRMDTKRPERSYGFKDACSRLVELDEELTLPAGYRMTAAPLKDHVAGNAADFDGKLEQAGNRLRLNGTLTLKKRVYEASDWKNFREAVEAYRKYGNHLVIEK